MPTPLSEFECKEADKRASLIVKEALQRIHKALARNSDISPFGPIPYGEEGGIGGTPNAIVRRMRMGET
jgi:hypothetical protein